MTFALTRRSARSTRKKPSREYITNQLMLHVMMIPAVVLVILFSYVPMFGVIMAFQKFNPVQGFWNSPWVGLGNFTSIMSTPDFWIVLRNTVWIAFLKIVAGLIVPITFALLLNELRQKLVKRTIQTLVYLPYFLSWVILGGIMLDILSPSGGVVNVLLQSVGIEPIFFLGNPRWFPWVLVITDTWKNFGFGTIIYLAALTSVDPTLYEAAILDGANRWQQTLFVTLPGISGIIALMTILSLGSVLDAGFDQVFNMYNPLVYSTGDILDTLIYRLGLKQMSFSIATAVGLVKSIVAFILIITSWKLADKYAGYRIF